MRPVHVLPLLWLVACVPQQGVTVAYQPRSVVRVPAVADEAVMVYADDSEALSRLGARPVGSVVLTGNGALHARAACEVAEHGGTHYLVADEGADVERYELAPARSVTRLDPGGDSITTTHQRAAVISVATDRLRVVALRLDPERWSELPAPLRPQGRGRTERGPCR